MHRAAGAHLPPFFLVGNNSKNIGIRQLRPPDSPLQNARRLIDGLFLWRSRPEKIPGYNSDQRKYRDDNYPENFLAGVSRAIENLDYRIDPDSQMYQPENSEITHIIHLLFL